MIEKTEDLLEKFPQQIYGLITADEGWRFVPKDVAIERISTKWRTRNFLFVIPFSRCVLLINFVDGKDCKRYIESQKRLRNAYGYMVEEYFTFKPEIAGLNHGPLLALENTSVYCFLLEQILYRITETRPKNINEFLDQREWLIKALDKLSGIRIREISILEKILWDSMLLTEKTKEANKKLEEIERALIIKYNQKINNLIVIVAIIGIIVAVLSLLSAFI